MACNITGTIADAGNDPLDGQLVVTLDSPLVDDSLSPDTVLVPAEHSFSISNGVVNISLPQSETSLITYRFRFFEWGETAALLDFRARVPNVSDIDFSQLIPTGLTTDTLDTSIRRLAQVITQTPGYADALRGLRFRGAYNSATLYRSGDAVNYSTYTWVWYNDAPGSAQTPSEPSAYWQKLNLVA